MAPLRQTQQAGLGRSIFDGQAGLQQQPEEEELRRLVGDNTGGFLADLFNALDTPGAAVRGVLAGKTGANDERVSGRDLLRQAGLAGNEDTWGNFLGGVATETVLDPLSWLSGPVKALTGAGRAAGAAGLLADAPALLSRQALAGRAAPEIAERAAASLKRIGPVTEADVAARPLVGRRAAMKFGTLGDLVENASNPVEAKEAVVNYLRRKTPTAPVSDFEDAYQSLTKQTLGRDVGIGLPFMDPVASFNVPVVGQAYSDLADSLGAAYRWSPVGRALAKFGDNTVGNALDAESQMTYAGAEAARKAAEAKAREESVYQVAKLYQAEPDVFTEGGNRALGRLIEQPAEGAFKAQDSLWDSNHPAARSYMDWWKEKATQLPEEFTELGLRGAKFSDPNVSGYLPRKTGGLLDDAAARNPSLGRVLSTITSDQLQRSEQLMVPGGRDTIAFELSRDPFIAGTKRAAKNDEEAAQHIAQKLFGGGGAPVSKGQLQQSRYLAGLLHRLPDSVLRDAPLFGQHPTQMISGYVAGREGAKAVQTAIYDSLAKAVVDTPAALADGGNHISLSEALHRLDARTTKTAGGEVGARPQMRERLAEALGMDPDKVDINTLSVPEEHINRLLRVRDGYTNPAAAEGVKNLLDNQSRLWKQAILAWPSTRVRDLYSGAYSNWLEGAFDPLDVLPGDGSVVGMGGLKATRQLLATSAYDPDFVKFLDQIPGYDKFAADDKAARFYAELAGSGLLEGGIKSDIGDTISGGASTANLVGTTPETVMGAVSELYKTRPGRTWAETLPFKSTEAPLLRFGAKLGDLTDKVNRISGYLSLRKQGVAPAEAARRMKRAHVDYASLTPSERYIRDNFFPWYAYTSRIFQEVVRQMIERPGGRYGQGLRAYQRAQENDGQYVPENLRMNFAAAIDPNDPLGGLVAPLDDSVTRYLTGIDLPGFSQLQMLTTNPNKLAKNVLMQLSPGKRVIGELAFDEDLFTGAPVRNLPTILEKGVELVPGVARPYRAVKPLLSNRNDLSLGTRAFSAAWNQTGLGKFRDVTEADITRDAISRLQERAAPYTRDMTVPYIPESLAPSVPQDAVDSLALARRLRENQRKVERNKEPNPFDPHLR